MATNLPLKLGQELQVRWRGATGPVRDVIDRLKLDPTKNGGPEVLCFVTFIDARGVSIYIVREASLGPDLRIFVPADMMWQSYFEPLSFLHAVLPQTSHYSQEFPRQFV